MAARRWPDDVKARALSLYRTKGRDAAVEATQVPAKTIDRWARDAGLKDSTEKGRQQVEAATQMSSAARRQRVGEALDVITERLAGIALGAMELEAEVIDIGRSMAQARRVGQKPDQRLLDRMKGILDTVDMRDVTIARSRAIGDLVRIRDQQARLDDDGNAGDLPRTLVFASPAWADVKQHRVYRLDPETNRVIDGDLELEAAQDEMR